MDPETNLPDLTDDLASTIDDLTTALAPLLTTPLPTQASTLPTLDKAKLHILTAYALESLLFSALAASGADAKAHPVFAEIARLKTYFGKLKAAEQQAPEAAASAAPTTKLDKDAAARFIRHGLAGNERFDKERAERLAKERARAALKARMVAARVNRKFDDAEEERVQAVLGRKRKAEDAEGGGASSSEDEEEDAAGGAALKPRAGDVRDAKDASSEDHVDSENAEFYGEEQDEEEQPADVVDAASASAAAAAATTPSKPPKKSKPAKKDKASKKRRKDPPPPREQELILPERAAAPRTHSETFNALLAGTFAEQKKGNGKGKGKKARK